jgi:Na+/H+ antiporter NhaC
MDYGILSLAPALIALILAFITRDALFSIILGVLVGIGISGENLLFGFTGILQSALGNADFIWVAAIEVFIGILVAFFMKSGAIQGVTDFVGRKNIKQRGAQIAAALLGVFIFFSDYFSPLFVGNTMRGVTDKARVSREKLAYICDCTSAPVCILVPFTSWGVYVAGLLVGIGALTDVSISTDAVIRAVPFQFYGFLTLAMVFALASGVLKDFGPMAKAEKRALETGQVYAEGSNPLLSEELETIKPREGIKCNLFVNFLMPAIIIIVITVGTWQILGSAKTLEAFVVAVAYQFVTLLVQKMASLKEIMDCVMIGIRSVMGATMILAAAYCINSISKTLGTANFIISISEAWITPATLLFLTFLVCAVISFFTGTSWGTYAIMIPICIPLAFSMTGGETTNLIFATIAAVMGGGAFGDHCSPLSDTTILSSLGAGSDHIDHTKTQLPYALTVAAVSSVAYLILGFTMM